MQLDKQTPGEFPGPLLYFSPSQLIVYPFKLQNQCIAKYPYFFPPGMSQVTEAEVFIYKEMVISIRIKAGEVGISARSQRNRLHFLLFSRIKKECTVMPVKRKKFLPFRCDCPKYVKNDFIHMVYLLVRHILYSKHCIFPMDSKGRFP